jgi:dTDP-4-dehydrorhamnose reductase
VPKFFSQRKERKDSLQQVCVSMKACRVLVTGAGGQLGSRVVACASARPEVDAVGMSREELDVCDAEAVAKVLEHVAPEVVIHTAAYTAVDAAEENEAEALRINGEAVGTVAQACASRQISLLHLSTDYVFGDVPRRPLLPTDPTGPLGAYARTKLAGEKAFMASGVIGAVVRVAWLYDAEGRNFMNTMLRLAQERGELNVVSDQSGVPTAAPVLAEALLDMAVKREGMPQGVWHFAHAGHTTWHGFASEIMAVAGLDVPVHPVRTEAFPTPAKRPAWSVLDGEPLRLQMGWPVTTWQEALQRCWELRRDV